MYGNCVGAHSMSKLMSGTMIQTLVRPSRHWEIFAGTAVHTSKGSNVSFYASSIFSPRIIGLMENYSTFGSILKAIQLSQIQQSREMSWGNVHLPNPRGKNRPNKHTDPRWAKLRKWKEFKIELPDREFDRKIGVGKISPEEIRAEMKLKGILPPTRWTENASYIAATGTVLDPYKPTEGNQSESDDPESTGWSLKGTLRKTAEKAKSKTFRATRKVRTYDDNFDASTFALYDATEVYKNAHKALAGKDEKRLHQLATEKAFPEMIHNTKNKSIYWEFIKSLEAPHVVQVRCEEVLAKGNLFAQVTVRFHTQQILAVYDRFGRLIHGNPNVAKDVLEYVVFEKHLADTYGKWRLHAKILPRYAANERLGGIVTHVVKDINVEESIPKEDEKDDESVDPETEKKYGVSYKSDEESSSIFNRFGKMIKRS